MSVIWVIQDEDVRIQTVQATQTVAVEERV